MKKLCKRHVDIVQHEAQHEDDRDDAEDGHDDGGRSARRKQHEIEVQHVAQHQQVVHVEKAQQRRKHVVHRAEQHVDADSGAQNCADEAVEDRIRIGHVGAEHERCHNALHAEEHDRHIRTREPPWGAVKKEVG